jgi:hypothetical protein
MVDPAGASRIGTGEIENGRDDRLNRDEIPRHRAEVAALEVLDPLGDGRRVKRRARTEIDDTSRRCGKACRPASPGSGSFRPFPEEIPELARPHESCYIFIRFCFRPGSRLLSLDVPLGSGSLLMPAVERLDEPWRSRCTPAPAPDHQLRHPTREASRIVSEQEVRGTWGEVQLAGLLEHVLVPDQYAVNVATREGSGERVEFAIKLPGRGDADGDVVWLPIDAKFPQEDYLVLFEAQERGDLAAVEAAGKKLEQRIRACAKDICDRYLNPPATTDFGIMFLPTEGLYAEVIRRVGLIEWVQRECRVVIAGPTTLAALLNSLQMGFRTLAIERRSSEVWTVLGAVKTEFGKFGGVLDKVKKKLQEASNVVDTAQVRTRAMNRRLRDVEDLPVLDAEVLLLGQGAVHASADEEDGELIALVEV